MKNFLNIKMNESILIKKDMFSDAVRFIIAGGINTLLTLIIYQLCLLFLRHDISYIISWIVGITFLIVFYPTRVFPQGHNTWRRKVLIVGLYIVNFFVSLWLLDVVVNYGIFPQIAILFALMYTTLMNFFGMRFILRK